MSSSWRSRGEALGRKMGWTLALAGVAAQGDSAPSWSVVWDGGANDRTVAAGFSAAHGIRVLTESGSLLAISAEGVVLWTVETGLEGEMKALSLRDDGVTAVLAETGSGFPVRDLHFAVVDAGGALLWSRMRADAGGRMGIREQVPAPYWDEAGQRWLLPGRVQSDFAALGYTDTGTELPDIRWTPPTPSAASTLRASSVLPRPGGGVLLAGIVFPIVQGPTAVPVWWTVALDAGGNEVWRNVSDGGTQHDAFSGAHLLSADPVILWANDETACGVFSLHLWSLHPQSGQALWARTWPLETAAPDCKGFISGFSPDEVRIDGASIVAGGLVAENIAQVFAADADTGLPRWHATQGSQMIATRLALGPDDIMLLSSQFPPGGSGAPPLIASAWRSHGVQCQSPQQVAGANMRLLAAWADNQGRRFLVGTRWSAATFEDVVVHMDAGLGCGPLFKDGFE